MLFLAVGVYNNVNIVNMSIIKDEVMNVEYVKWKILKTCRFTLQAYIAWFTSTREHVIRVGIEASSLKLKKVSI